MHSIYQAQDKDAKPAHLDRELYMDVNIKKTGNILSHSIGCLSIIIRLTEEIFVEVGRMWGVEPMMEAPYYTHLWPTPDLSLFTFIPEV